MSNNPESLFKETESVRNRSVNLINLTVAEEDYIFTLVLGLLNNF